MIDIKNSFTDIKSLIQHLKMKEQVVGIVEYGGRTFADMEIGGDYDLTVILNKPISKNFTGVHFHVAGIPIDCMILSVEDFLTDNPRDPFFLVHLNCNILFDRNDITKKILERINSKWKLPEELSDFEKHLFRFTFQHILDKLEHHFCSLRTSLHRVQVPPTRNGYEGPVQRRQKYKTLDDMVTSGLFLGSCLIKNIGETIV